MAWADLSLLFFFFFLIIFMIEKSRFVLEYIYACLIFFWIRNLRWERWKGRKIKNEKWKKNELKNRERRKKSGEKKNDQVREMGPTNSVKNIEWWEVSDGVKEVWKIKWWVMNDELWVMSDEWWKLSDEIFESKQSLTLHQLLCKQTNQSQRSHIKVWV